MDWSREIEDGVEGIESRSEDGYLFDIFCEQVGQSWTSSVVTTLIALVYAVVLPLSTLTTHHRPCPPSLPPSLPPSPSLKFNSPFSSLPFPHDLPHSLPLFPDPKPSTSLALYPCRTPLSNEQAVVFWESPDAILCNGPGTCVPVAYAAKAMQLVQETHTPPTPQHTPCPIQHPMKWSAVRQARHTVHENSYTAQQTRYTVSENGFTVSG